MKRFVNINKTSNVPEIPDGCGKFSKKSRPENEADKYIENRLSPNPSKYSDKEKGTLIRENVPRLSKKRKLFFLNENPARPLQAGERLRIESLYFEIYSQRFKRLCNLGDI